jgi:hypothetical protein
MTDDMGILRTDMEIESPLREGDRRLLRDVLVDTGAELSWAPTAVLESLGIARRKPRRFQPADGTVVERWVGFASRPATRPAHGRTGALSRPRSLRRESPWRADSWRLARRR